MAIAGVYNRDIKSNCFQYLSDAMLDLTHLGQESYSMLVSDGKRLTCTHGKGSVHFIPVEDMAGYVGVGSNSSHPVSIASKSHSPKLKDFTVVFDGYFVNGKALREKHGGSSDADLTARFIADADDFTRGIENITGEARGSFCAIALTERGEMYVTRSPLGVQPLIYGKGESGQAVVTESRALSNIDMELVRDVKAGEMLAMDASGIHPIGELPSKKHVCTFLWGYFAYPDSTIEGLKVELIRKESCAILARKDRELGLKADFVVPVPDSGKKYAEGYAIESGVPCMELLYKYPYKGRSYMRPGQQFRDIIAGKKITILPRQVKDRVIVLTEDSIRRGTQIIRKRGPIDLLRTAGAKEIHLRVGTPRNKAFCRFLPPDGDMYDDSTLAANRYPTDEELRKYLGVDSVRIAELDDFVKIFSSRGLPEKEQCLGCYTGDFGFLD